MSVNKKYSKFKPLIFVSIVYLVCIAILCLGDISEIKEMKPNEWGDFLAGTFAPLAFMWLVFGYRQQGEELNQNTIALRLQSEELANNVEQQRQLVETAKDELSLTLEQIQRSAKREILHSQPYVHVSIKAKNGSPNGITTFESYKESDVKKLYLKVKFTNSRAVARDFKVRLKTQNSLIHKTTFNVFNQENPAEFQCFLSYPECYESSEKLYLKIICEYIDELDCNQKLEFAASVQRNYDREIQETTTQPVSRSF